MQRSAVTSFTTGTDMSDFIKQIEFTVARLRACVGAATFRPVHATHIAVSSGTLAEKLSSCLQDTYYTGSSKKRDGI